MSISRKNNVSNLDTLGNEVGQLFQNDIDAGDSQQKELHELVLSEIKFLHLAYEASLSYGGDPQTTKAFNRHFQLLIALQNAAINL